MASEAWTAELSPLSRTCQNCADSKVRCVRNGEEVCTRCRRLGKECVERKARRRFYGFQKDLKIKALESKIDELKRTRTASSRSRSPNSVDSIDAAPIHIAEEDVIDHGFLSMDMAESLVHTFKNDMLSHFPFVIIPPLVSAADLRREKPFLFLAILVSASFLDVALQRALDAEVKKAVASHMIINGKISFDLLQGLMVYIAWTHYHARPHRYSQFMQLAISIIIELRLDRAPQTKTWKTGIRFADQPPSEIETHTRPYWGLDEQRAIVGCYYLASTISILTQKQSNFPHTPYIESCSKSVYNAGGAPYDKYMFYIVRLQVLAEKIDRLSIRHAVEFGSPGSAAELYVTSLKSDLETFVAELPFGLYDFPLLAIQFQTAELCLYQLSLSAIKQPILTHAPPGNRFGDEFLYAALVAASSTLNVYLSLPSASETALSNTQWVQLGFAMIVGSKLIATASSKLGPEPAVAQRRASWISTLEQLRLRISVLATAHTSQSRDRNVFDYFQQRVVYIQRWFDRQDAPAALSIPTSDSEGFMYWENRHDLFADINFEDFFTSPEDEHLNVAIDRMMNGWVG
ncbi:hypothetical protein BGW36DRAFT_369406 [Talaromyces proteolyticus]|uniref:Zn(2)-C6 fungal-type domain-containing protein n=1 Tax=Talaromyces proteolyticus TaxID=1131652 RepID=A0AAD4Q2A9_9EURO|nr:uncharacterized protein BGW36DRAFT_369406 [Talaromyces proteolyticus]KAH8703487.1 hypothetical protein BGW36DRAFT_369406 [Talaromyces proteolyticus]